jgi:hypothetical protein
MRFRRTIVAGALGLSLAFSAGACSPVEDEVDQVEDDLEDKADEVEEDLRGGEKEDE